MRDHIHVWRNRIYHVNSGDTVVASPTGRACPHVAGIPLWAVADGNGLCMDMRQKRSAAFATSALETDRRSLGRCDFKAKRKHEERAHADAWEKKVKDYTIANVDRGIEDVFP